MMVIFGKNAASNLIGLSDGLSFFLSKFWGGTEKVLLLIGVK